ncbi:MAG: S8 family serine peptidase [Caldisericaceae bacterium]|nr:S8 family serine peptidase [Caldisericaceae bacterium]
MKKFIVLVIALTVILSLFTVKTAGSAEEKISSSLMHLSEENVSIIVELTDTPAVVYKKTLKFKLLTIFIDDSAERHAAKLELKQNNLIKYMERFNIEVQFNYTYLFNGFSCTVNRKHMMDIAENRNVKRIFEDKKAYLERTYATNVIKSDVVNRMTDSSGAYITGKGVVVGLVDTGVDYGNTELGGGGFPNAKIIGGYDFADMDSNPMDTDGHGTHVAGIIGGSNYGVAPDVKIRAYKVFTGNTETTSISTIVKGIDEAAKDKCDIINISIGTVGGAGVGGDPESIAVENATADGIVVVAAAGNYGSRSDLVPFPMSAPASSESAIGVGASSDAMHGVIAFWNKDIRGTYPENSPFFTDGSYDIVYCGYGLESDFSGKNLTGKIALVSRGIIYFGDKDINAKNAGAKGIIVFNNVSGLQDIELLSQFNPEETDFIPFLFISYTDGLYIKQRLTGSTTIKLSNEYGLGRIASFSANGPTIDFYMKPDLVAPGVDITSTVLNNNKSLASGTSMAAPFVSGSAALIKQARKSLKPAEIKSILMNTACILENSISGEPYSPLMQGSGRVDVQNAVNSTALVRPASFIFGNDGKERIGKFTVKNLSSNSLFFSISYSTYSNETVKLTYPENIYVAPFSEKSFTVDFKADESIQGEVYGFIYLEGESAILHIPFVYLPLLKERHYIENVFQSGDTLTADNNIEINFTVGLGIEDDTSQEPYRENNAGEIRVDIYDTNGRFIDTIFDESAIYIGDYSVNLNGRDIFSNYFLKDEKYYYKISYLEANNDESTIDMHPVILRDEKSGSFNVLNRRTNYLNIYLEEGKTPLLKKGEDFWVDLSFKADQSLTTLFISFKYDQFLLKILEIEQGEVALNENVTFVDSVQSGTVYVTLSGEIGETGIVARIHLEAIENGVDFIYLGYVSSSPQEYFILRPLKYKTSDYSRIWDVNNDKKVDDFDVDIFRESFGLNKNEANFNLGCDFNRDGIVDGKDFLILTEHYGELYP